MLEFSFLPEASDLAAWWTSPYDLFSMNPLTGEIVLHSELGPFLPERALDYKAKATLNMTVRVASLGELARALKDELRQTRISIMVIQDELDAPRLVKQSDQTNLVVWRPANDQTVTAFAFQILANTTTGDSFPNACGLLYSLVFIAGIST